MADILSFTKPDPVHYSVDVTLYPDDLLFTLHNIKVDSPSLLKIAAELERIAGIIRTDVVTGAV